MDNRLPYYMAYPLPLQFDDERIERRDLEYIKGMYPAAARRLLPYVEAECDRMEYEGSMIYDKYPDQLQLRLMSGRIYDKVKNLEGMYEDEPQYEAQEHRNRRRNDDWLRDMVSIMLFQELYKRRCDHRRCRRKYY